jgi:alkylation response protein AidB-like acyl-CoA dehydrogenase
MSIGISVEHAELAASVRKWAEAAGAVEAVRRADADGADLRGWSERYAELGLATIAVPAPYGGEGNVLDQAVALEAAAYALVPGPLLTSAVAGLVITDDGLRGALSRGAVSVGLAVDGVVLDAEAEQLLVGRAGHWHLVDTADAAVRLTGSVDLTRSFGTLTELPEGALRVELDDERSQDLVQALAAAEAAGLARWCLDTAVAYAGVREQFGRKIGAFQAVKHLCAEMLETSEAVTAAAWDAALAIDGAEPDERRLAALVAAVTCFDGAVAVATSCIQVLGGIGFTYEHDAHLYLRRALALRSFFGGSHTWAADLARHAATGVRRTSAVDFEGRDEPYRDEARASAERVAGLPEPERREALAASGLLAPHWPAPYGLGADPVQQLVIDEELQRAGVQRPDLKIGAWAAPTILRHGDDAQRERFLGPTLRGEIRWCQLFSEPGAGSDLASLRTRAVRDDAAGGWRLTGQKVWTSLAHEADWAICLARTADPETGGKPHAGISYFLVDMRAAGIEIRPLRELTGEAMFNEVFLDDVLVPDTDVVGDVDGGWRLAVTTLANERVAMAGSRLGDSVERAVELAGADGEAAVGRAVALATVVGLLGVRSTLRSLAGQGPGAESSVAKLLGVRSRQDSAELVVELLGRRALTDDALATAANHELLLTRCLSIAGGTTQVLRNVVGERVLGLPRD